MIVLKYGCVQSFKLEPGQFGHNKPTQREYKPESTVGGAASPRQHLLDMLNTSMSLIAAYSRRAAKKYVTRYLNLYYLGVGG